MNRLANWFRVESTERPLFFLLAGAVFFLTAANTLLFNLLQAFLIKRAGVDYLPYFYICSSAAIFIGSWVTLRPLKSWKPTRQGTAYVLAALAGAAFLAATQHLFSRDSGLIAAFLFVSIGLLVNSAAIIGTLEKISVVTSDAYNSEQQRRLTPLLTSVATVSGLGAGLLQAVISRSVGSGFLFAIVAGFLVPAAWFMYRLRRSGRAISVWVPESGQAPVDADGAKPRGLAAIISDKRLRRFLYILGGIVALSMVFTRIFNYQLSAAADSRFPTEAGLNAFFGWFTVMLSVGTLVFVNSAQRLLLERHGLVRNLILIPVLVMAGTLAMVALPVFAVVVGVVFVRELLLPLQVFSVQGSLGCVSDQQRKQAWSWLEGPVVTVGSLVGSGLLIVMSGVSRDLAAADVIRILAITTFFLLAVRLYLTIMMRRGYPVVLLRSLQRGDFKTRLRATENMSEMRFMPDRHLGEVLDIVRNENEPTALRLAALRSVAAIKDPSSLRVVSRLLGHPDRELRLEAVRTVAAFRYQPDRLYESGFSRHVLIERLRVVFADEKHHEVFNAILDALIALRDPDIVDLISASLESPSPEMRHSALRSLRQFKDPAIIDYVTPFLSAADPDLRAQAIVALWRFPWERRAVLRRAIDELVNSPGDSEQRRQGLYLIGTLRLAHRRPLLLEALASAAPGIRLTAAISLLKLGDESGVAVIEQAMRSGTSAEAHEIERLAEHPAIPERQQDLIRALIHEYHLHYPPELPVSESLRIRLRDIPRPCLDELLGHYRSPDSLDEQRKIRRTLDNADFPALRGRVVLAGLDQTWRQIAEIALLAGGFMPRSAAASQAGPGELVVGTKGTPGLTASAFILSDKSSGLNEREVASSHFAPSELLAAIRRVNPDLFR